MIHPGVRSVLLRTGIAVVVVLAGTYVYASLRQGIPGLVEKRRELRSLQEENADLARRLVEKRERIRRLSESEAEQQLEIRKQLKLVQPGDTEFIIPEKPKPETPE